MVVAMLPSLTLLLVCQLIGEIVVRLFGLPVPGPVLGMVLLFLLLLRRDAVSPDMEATSRGLLDNLSLLFVPAGVGVIQYLDRIAAEWLAITASVIGSTILTIAVSAAVMNRLIRKNRS
jgi:putative effector of murein hydrolase LrgA (UPF0299 family)